MLYDLEKLIDAIIKLPNCTVYPAQGLPEIEGKHSLPTDVIEFYTLCGGSTLFENEKYIVDILPPDEVVLANPLIVGERCEDDITSEWYVIARDSNGDYLTIDLNSKRLGKCYDSFWDRHGVVGECAIIALSFTDLLGRLIENKGQHWYWLKEDFISMGDAYDGIEISD